MTASKARVLLIGLGVILVALMVGAGIYFINVANHRADIPVTMPSVQAGQQTAAPGVVEDLKGVDRTDRDAVALAAARIMTTWNPKNDLTETAAAIRASPLLSQELAQNTVEPLRGSSNATWAEMAARNAVTDSIVEFPPDEHEDERPNPDALTLHATWEWVGDNVRLAHPDTRIFFMQMKKNNAQQWEVAGYTYNDVPTRYLTKFE